MYVFSSVTSFFILIIMIHKFIHVLSVVKFTHPGIGRYLDCGSFLGRTFFRFTSLDVYLGW